MSETAPPAGTLRCGDRVFTVGARPLVVGIVNVTPDSFSDGGRFASVAAAVEHGLGLIQDGADVLDIGGESTRPGAAAVSDVEEQARVLPVVEGLARQGVRCLSIDTRHATTAARCLDVGASWINDVSGLTHDPRMPAVARKAAAVVLMHWRAPDPNPVQDQARYHDVVEEVYAALSARVAAAVEHGVEPARIIVDPGIGFGKTVDDNVALTRSLRRFSDLGPVLYGPSRKRFLGALAGVERAEDRDPATLAAVCFAATRGADLVRVHDVSGAVQALRVMTALSRVLPSAP